MICLVYLNLYGRRKVRSIENSIVSTEGVRSFCIIHGKYLISVVNHVQSSTRSIFVRILRLVQQRK